MGVSQAGVAVRRYLEVRKQLLASPRGRQALMDGRPNDLGDIDQHILENLQVSRALRTRRGLQPCALGKAR